MHACFFAWLLCRSVKELEDDVVWAERIQIDGRKEWEDDGSIKGALNIQKSDRIVLLLKAFFLTVSPCDPALCLFWFSSMTVTVNHNAIGTNATTPRSVSFIVNKIVWSLFCCDRISTFTVTHCCFISFLHPHNKFKYLLMIPKSTSGSLCIWLLWLKATICSDLTWVGVLVPHRTSEDCPVIGRHCSHAAEWERLPWDRVQSRRRANQELELD